MERRSNVDFERKKNKPIYSYLLMIKLLIYSIDLNLRKEERGNYTKSPVANILWFLIRHFMWLDSQNVIIIDNDGI